MSTTSLYEKQAGTIFEYISILIIYIYAFVYLEKDQTELTSLNLLFMIHLIFLIYCFVKTKFILKLPTLLHSNICFLGLHITNIFLFVSLILFYRVIRNMDNNFRKVKNEPIELPDKYEKEFTLYKKLFISCFSLLFVLFIGLTAGFPLINKTIDLSPSGIFAINNIIPLFFISLSLSSLGMSAYMVFQGNNFLKLSRTQIID